MVNIPKITVIDGSFSLQLSIHVGKICDGDPLWTSRFLVTDPDCIVQTHLDFLEAGSEVIETCTYQASVDGFMKYLNLNEQESIKLIKDSVEHARDAINKYNELHPERAKLKVLIAGSVGPYGAYLHDGSEYSGVYANNVTKESLQKWHSTRIEALIDAGVDILALETIPCMKEGEALVELLKNYPNIKAWLSFSCKDGTSISNGDDFQKSARHCYDLNPEQLLAVGLNCTSPKYVNQLIGGINDDRNDNKIPLIVYPNSGEEYDYQYGWTGKNDCRPLKEYVESWLDNGVAWIGGCCRTSASDITEVKHEVQKWIEKKKLMNN